MPFVQLRFLWILKLWEEVEGVHPLELVLVVLEDQNVDEWRATSDDGDIGKLGTNPFN